MRISKLARRLLPLGTGVCLLSLVFGGAAPPWQSAAPGFSWSFPRDHFGHPDYRIEWWYFTGQLETVPEPVRTFGYQFTLFRVGLSREAPELDSVWSASSLLMGHASVTDVTRGEHRFSEVLYRTMPLLAGFDAPPGPRIAWSRGPAGTDDVWELRWNGEGFDFHMQDAARGIEMTLSTRPGKPLVFQGPGGFSRKADEAGAASLYYSFTRLDTEGALRLDGETLEVRGTSWMDKEFSSSQLGSRQVGWDWFSLQLDDGRELMLYRLRREDGTTDYSRGTMVGPKGESRYLGPDEWSARPTGSWKSAETSATYPAGWVLSIPGEGLELTVQPLVADQENVAELAGRLFYWEGTVRATDSSGAERGRGYVELVGYGEANRPPV